MPNSIRARWLPPKKCLVEFSLLFKFKPSAINGDHKNNCFCTVICEISMPREPQEARGNSDRRNNNNNNGNTQHEASWRAKTQNTCFYLMKCCCQAKNKKHDRAHFNTPFPMVNYPPLKLRGVPSRCFCPSTLSRRKDGLLVKWEAISHFTYESNSPVHLIVSVCCKHEITDPDPT